MKTPLNLLYDYKNLKLRLGFEQGVNRCVSPGLSHNEDVKVKKIMSVVAISRPSFRHRINRMIPRALLTHPPT